jgi:multisubunit Na+/H+ antiporter MnhE subunit
MHVFSISLYEARKITPDNVGISIEVWTENHKHGLGNLISIDPWTCLVEKKITANMLTYEKDRTGLYL